MGRSRKSRPSARRAAPAPVEPTGPQAPRGSTEELLSRGERRKLEDDRLRASLVPLDDREYPAALKVAIGVALVLGVVQLALGLLHVDVGGDEPPLSGVIGFSGLMLIAAWGMWRHRYWAVLGFQCLLGIVIVVFALLLFTAETLLAALISVAFIVAPGWLFWKLVRVLARMQVPERPGAAKRSG